MLAAIVLAWGSLTVITSSSSVPTAVTHDCTCGIYVSPSLIGLPVDRRLLFAGDRVYRPKPQRSPAAVLVALLLLQGGVERNPGPTAVVPPCDVSHRSATSRQTIHAGVLNVRSARHKAALIHDVIHDNRLDVLCLTETWIPADAPDAIKLDCAPPGYAVLHRHRGSSTDRRGGGVALIHRDSIKATSVDVGDFTEFESLSVKLVGRQSRSVVVVCVYRPPGPVSSTFIDQLSDLFDQLVLLDCKFVVVGDFNVPGDNVEQLNSHVVDLFNLYNLHQHVSVPTHVSGNVLDLILSQDGDVSSPLVSEVSVQSVCFSDHHLLTCHLGVPQTPPVVMTYSYRSLRTMDTAAFCHDILRSKLFSSTATDADEYAELFDAEVRRVLDLHAPLRASRRRCGQHDNRSLSEEARRAKQLRRRLERRYRRTGLLSDKQAYLSACLAARDSIVRSHADRIKSELDEVSGDVGATWRTVQRLHGKHKTVYDDAESAKKLVSTFCQFFAEKVKHIRDSISDALTSSARRMFAVRLQQGLELSSLQPDSRQSPRLLSSMPSKLSLLDVLVSLLKSCTEVFAPVNAILANLSLQS